MAQIIEINGLIFDSVCQTIVNPVNCKGIMGKGLALEFKLRFPEMFKNYYDVCQKKLLKPGSLLLYIKTKPWILNFPTKFDWKQPSKIEYIESGLIKFSNIYKTKGITSVAFPKLGSDLGGLEWDIVRPLMYKYLFNLEDLIVEIYHYSPTSLDSFFDKFKQKSLWFSITDFKKIVGLTLKQSRIIYEALKSDEIHSMLDIQNLDGIGEKSIEKIYGFTHNSSFNLTDIQPSLF